MLNPRWLKKISLGEYEILQAGDTRLSDWAPGAQQGNRDRAASCGHQAGSSQPAQQSAKGFFAVHGIDRLGLRKISESAGAKGHLCELVIPKECVGAIRRDLVLPGTERVVLRRAAAIHENAAGWTAPARNSDSSNILIEFVDPRVPGPTHFQKAGNPALT